MKSGVLVLILLFVSCKINRTKNGVPVGKWKYITQSGKNTDRVVGRYNRFGNEKGKWRYYYNDTLYRFEKYQDRKSTRLNSSHVRISYAVFCLKKKKK